MIYESNGKTINFEHARVMAIVNLTPDSFYDGGKYDTIKDVLNDAEQKIKAGAQIIDVGAFSSRPGAKEISECEEWERLQPAIDSIQKNFPDTILSVDTYRSSTARKAFEHGAHIINDISGGNFDPDMFKVIKELDVAYILMHMKGMPENMQDNPTYVDVVKEVRSELETKISQLEAMHFTKIIVDAGFGFGKSVEDNFKLLKALSTFSFGKYQVLAGLSRKSMINKVIKTNPVTALNGTTVLNTIALLNGASILRVHDVTEARQAIELVEYYKNV